MLISWTQRLVLLAVGLTLLGVTLTLIRKRRLREEYAVLWVLTGLLFLVITVSPALLYTFARWLGLDFAVLLTFVAFGFLASIVLHYSVVISRQSDREKRLAQEIALLREELDELRERLGQDAPAAAPGPREKEDAPPPAP